MRRIAFGLVSLTSFLVLALVGVAYLQGPLSNADLAPGAQFRRDSSGVISLEGSDWIQLMEAQGYIVAAERLWQMDLMRRSASGRLAEWFGSNPKAIEHDQRRKMEDWDGTAERAVEDLPQNQKEVCEAYARGVNRFIADKFYRWGIEYLLLFTAPEPWSCKDTLLILLTMSDQLSSTQDQEASNSLWTQKLPRSWAQFLFTEENAWNQPLFGKARPFPWPEKTDFLKPDPLGSPTNLPELDMTFQGSNAWTVLTGKDRGYLANDPHLGLGVPRLWYAVRLRRSKHDWIAGVTLPGIPAVVMGRNAYFAWGFTNCKEDVDDRVEETLSEDGNEYLADGSHWKPLIKKEIPHKIKGKPTEKIVARFTHRGPLVSSKYFPGKVFSRQWLGFQPKVLRLPTLEIGLAKNWNEFNHALDSFKVPAQAVHYIDTQGNRGLRVSGLGIRRARTGLVIHKGILGQWTGLEDVEERPRTFIPANTQTGNSFTATANERLWVGDYPNYWASDLRKKRIRDLLQGMNQAGVKSNQAIQLDTSCEFCTLFLRWIVAGSDSESNTIHEWKSWDGNSRSQPKTFTQFILVQRLFVSEILRRLGQQYGIDPTQIPYEWRNQTAWWLQVIERPDGLQPFGLDRKEFSNWLITEVSKVDLTKKESQYPWINRWQAQHPFVATVPVLGWFFKVAEYPQLGSDGLVRVERPKFGAGIRVIWNPSKIDENVWSLPVGNSGHFLSPFYQNTHEAFSRGEYSLVFPPNEAWEVAH